MADVLFQVDDGVATLTLNRPEKYNSFDPPFIKEVRKVFEDALRNRDVEAIVWTGAGKAFCAGGDVGSMKASLNKDPSRLFEELTEHFHPVVAGIRKAPKPIVAAVNGPVAGGGFGLALACDVRIASTGATFKPGYSRLGIVPDGGLTFFLPRMVGFGAAQRIIMNDETVNAEQALALGLVDRLEAPENVLKAAQREAARLISQPAESFRLTKELLTMSYLADLDLQLERERRRIIAAARGPWLREGITAFFEKRDPVFRTKRKTPP